jgi:Peptidase family S41
VFDMRGYPTENDVILDHLLDAPEDSLWMHVPRFVEPDGRVAGWHDIGWHRRPAEPHIAAPVVFLISAEAISYAESMLSYVEAHELGTLVGTTTAGANGDVVRFDTLAGFFVIYSGMRVTRHDGSPFHQGGVRPQVEVHRTIAGLRAGRDEVLEAGLRVLRDQVVPADPARTARVKGKAKPRESRPT